MNRNDQSLCNRTELVRDYSFDELAPAERRDLEQHLTACSDCVGELDRLRLTTAVLRVLPDQEIPSRISFVSESTAPRGWFSAFWNSAARLGFASACVLAAGLSFSAYRYTANTHPPDTTSAVQTAQVTKTQLDEAITKAVAQAVEKTHADDVRMTNTALNQIETKYAQQARNLMIAAQENMDLQQRTLHTRLALLSDSGRPGVSQ